MSYVKANVVKPTGIAPGKGADKKDKVTIFDFDDLTNEASRDAKGILISGSHVFKSNAYAIQLYMTPGSFEGKSNSEGDFDAEGFMQEVKMDHPGSKLDLLEFRQNWINKNIGIIIERCSDGSKEQYGATCAPLRLKVEGQDTKEMNKSTFTFSSANKGPDIAKYEGTVPLPSVADTVDADATSVDLANGSGEYQLTDNAAATEITTCSNAADGLVFTLLGSGGSNPATIPSGNDFLLKNGTTWTGLANSKITFKAFKDGAATYKFYELSRQ